MRSVLLIACLAMPGLAMAASPGPGMSRERDVEGRYRVRVTLSAGELRRAIYPRVSTELTAQGDDGIVRKLRLPVELYTQVRDYESAPDDRAGSSYERAYQRLVEAGDCRPLTAGFREASFDCGAAKGRRTVAVREDARGTYFSWESVAGAQLPDGADFERARVVLDDLTDELLEEAAHSSALP